MTETKAPDPRRPIDWERALERLRGAYAEKTLADCVVQVRRFEAWCAREGLQAFPASPETLVKAVDWWFETLKPHTVRVRIWAVRRVHEACDLPDPTRHPDVRLAYRRGAAAQGELRFKSRSRQALPVNAQLRDRLLETCPDTLLGVRDRAILWLGYDTLCRQAELIALRLEDLERLPEGGARILVRRSKTDPFGKGEPVFLSRTGLAAVDAWLCKADVREGPILRLIYFTAYVGGGATHASFVKDRLRLMATRAGLPPETVRRIGGHSMRVGATHDLLAAGHGLPQLMRAGRWRTMATVACYLREAPINIWTTPADTRAPAARRRAPER